MSLLFGLMGVDEPPAWLEVAGFQMYFINDCCYVKIKLYQDYILYNKSVVLYDFCGFLGKCQFASVLY